MLIYLLLVRGLLRSSTALFTYASGQSEAQGIAWRIWFLGMFTLELAS